MGDKKTDQIPPAGMKTEIKEDLEHFKKNLRQRKTGQTTYPRLLGKEN